MRKRLAVVLIAILSLSTLFPPIGKAAESISSQVVSIAKDNLGAPYRSGGSSPSGFDCSGFTSYVFNKVGIELSRRSEDQYNDGTKVEKANLIAGDLVFFKTTSSSRISHVGIYIGSNEFIHASTSKGVTIDSINDPYYWASRYVGGTRVIEEEEEEATEEVDAALIASLAPGEYLDIPKTYWAYDAITSLSKAGIISGTENGKFEPNKIVTRAEVAKMISVSLSLKPVEAKTPTYKDVPANHWAYTYIETLVEKDWFTRADGDSFKPNEAITRAEVAAIVTKAFDLKRNGTVEFTDVAADYWAAESIQAVATNGITAGFEDKKFLPAKEITRAEFTSLLYNALNL